MMSIHRPTFFFLAVLVFGLVLLSPALSAQDAPHWESTTITVDCTTPCHTNHQASGALTTDASNVNLCLSCHSLSLILPLSNDDVAVPGTGGTSHAFGVPTVHPVYDTRAPVEPEMSLRVMNDNVVCSTCHNQHASNSAFGGTSRIGPAEQTTSLGSTGIVTSGGTFNGNDGFWYLVEISQGGNQANARFRYSKDNGISFFAEQNVGLDVGLDSGVTVSFGAGNYSLGERWQFFASWPFLRAPLDLGDNAAGDAFCRDCHFNWVMTHTDVETWDGGFKSHPVGVGLDANAQGYDRPMPLDGNGAAQGDVAADANASNDLRLGDLGNVQCLTCHGVHFADSNTQTADGG